MARTAENVAADLSISDIYVDEERPLLRKIASFVERQAKQLPGMAKAMLAINEDSL
jgi:hypothetical protein